MKIRIKADGHNIRLWLPTSLLKSRIFYHILQHGVGKIASGVRKNAKNDENITQVGPKNDAAESVVQVKDLTQPQLNNSLEPTAQQERIFITRKLQLEMYRAIRHAIKTHGHFNLVEVESADGQRVLIRV